MLKHLQNSEPETFSQHLAHIPPISGNESTEVFKSPIADQKYGAGLQLGYDSLAVRNLLKDSFSDDDLTVLVYDHFRPVYQKFSAGMSQTLKRQELIDYCDKHNLYDKLVTLVRELNPSQYQRYESELLKPIAELVQIDLSKPTQVQLTIDFDLSDFTAIVQLTIISALALILKIPKRQIRRVNVRSGSVIFTVEIPINSAKRLEFLHNKQDPELTDLGVTKVKILITYFDPYSVFLLILSVLTTATSFTHQRSDWILENETHIQKRLRHLARLLYETANLLTLFRKFLKENNALQNEFQLGTTKILVNRLDVTTIDQISEKALRVSRLFLKIFNDFAFYLKPSEYDQFIIMMTEVETLLKDAVLTSNYQQLLAKLKHTISYIFQFTYEMGEIYEKDPVRFTKIFKSPVLFEDWKEVEPSSIHIWRIPVLKNISAGLGVIVKEDIVDYLDLYNPKHKDADFGVKVLGESMIGDNILPGDIVLIQQQSTVKIGELAAFVITTPTLESLGVLKRYYIIYRNHKNLAHWLLESSNPSSEHLVVIPSGADIDAIRKFYIQKIKDGKTNHPIKFYEYAELTIVGKYVGHIRED